MYISGWAQQRMQKMQKMQLLARCAALRPIDSRPDADATRAPALGPKRTPNDRFAEFEVGKEGKESLGKEEAVGSQKAKGNIQCQRFTEKRK